MRAAHPGGQYEAHLAVPVALYDQVTDDIREQVNAAIEAVYGADCYRGLTVGIRRADYRDGWDRKFIETLATAARGDSSGVRELPALPAGT